MQSRLLRPTQVFIIVSLVTIICLSTFILACNDQESPDEIRRRTAQATETMRRDTKAMVEGVKEGMGHNGAVNINKASREELLTLPDLTDREADRIIAERPFNSADDLVKRRIITQSEYDRIRDRVIAGR
ncbi:MAG: helix-hairpin-helix domain-containing protein [Candidatus Sulfotelmatobacter sp.]